MKTSFYISTVTALLLAVRCSAQPNTDVDLSPLLRAWQIELLAVDTLTGIDNGCSFAFAERAPAERRYNTVERDSSGQPAVELMLQRRDSGQVIVAGVEQRHLCTLHLDGALPMPLSPHGTFAISVAAHLYPLGEASTEMPLLEVETWCEVHDPSARHLQLQRLTKSDLLPESALDFEQYRHPSLLFRYDCSAAETPCRVQLRLRYLGGEKLALHSVSVRDSVAELLLGERQESRAYRTSVIEQFRERATDRPTVAAATRTLDHCGATLLPILDRLTRHLYGASVDELLDTTPTAQPWEYQP